MLQTVPLRVRAPATLLPAIAAAILAGCRSRPIDEKPMPEPTAGVRALPATVPRQQPLTVALTREQAVEQVERWSLPNRAARIGRSAYLLPAHVEEAFAAVLGSGTQSSSAAAAMPLVLFGGEVGYMDTSVSPAWLRESYAGPLIAVELTQAGMDLWSADQDREEGGVCIPVAARDRTTSVALFDASTGTYLGHLRESLPAAFWQRAASQLEIVERRAMPTATRPRPPTTLALQQPVPTEAPEHVGGESAALPLAVGQVPSAVQPLVDVLPWRSGARWTYRWTGVEDGLHWWTKTITETVEEARRLAPDLMAVRLAWSMQASRPAGPDRWGEGKLAVDALIPGVISAYALLSPWGQVPASPAGAGIQRTQLHLGPDRVFYLDKGQTASLDLDAFRASPKQGDSADENRQDDHSVMLRLPLKAGDHYGIWSVGAAETLTTAAGSFQACHRLSEIYSARSIWHHWLCPGVGFVRHERWGCTSYTGRAEVFELIDYALPGVTPVP